MTKRRHTGRPAPSYEAPFPPQPAPRPEPMPPADEPLESPPQPAPSMTPRPQPRPKVHEADRIGDILRRVREHRGEDIESISDYLRIRPSFLVALENSHYEELPADAYVIGFLRTYALYLGLDGRGAIDQYRREMAGRRRKPQLSMPQPMSEGKTPTVAVLIAAALAGLLIYGLWYGLSTPDRDAVEKPVPMPSITATAPEPVVPAAPPADPAAALAAPPPDAAPAPTGTNQASPTPAPAPVAASAPATETPDAAKAPAPAAAANNNKAQATPQQQPPTATASNGTPAQPHEEAKAPAPQPPASTETAEKPKEEPEAEHFGAPGKTHVTVKAEKESWVLITDAKGLTVFDRTLKPGESYSVPDGKGYNLTTGNVAGVSLVLDGKTLGKLPANGRVARNVPLDPDKLKARLAGKKTPLPNDSADMPPPNADKSSGIAVE